MRACFLGLVVIVGGSNALAGSQDSFEDVATSALDASAVGMERIPGGVLLRNRLHRLNAIVTPESVAVVTSGEGAQGSGFRLRCAGLGRPGRIEDVGAGQIEDDVARGLVEVRRARLTERYTNAVNGVRQDFIVHGRPAGEGALHLRLELTGAQVLPSASGVSVVLPCGRELTYDRLRVYDAGGNQVPARMDVLGGPHLAIVVEDADVTYPLTIDPTIGDADWQSMGGMPGANGFVHAALYHDGSLYIGGEFTTVGTTVANYVARWDGSAWSSLGTGAQNGTNAQVRALAAIGDIVYVAGFFSQAGGSTVGSIAAWDTAGGTWSDLDGGVNGQVHSLAVSGTTLYVGGFYSQAGTAPVAVNNIATYDTGTSTWSALGGGVDGQAKCIAVSGSIVYTAGTFTTVEGGTPASKVAKYESGSWSALGAGVNSTVSALAMSGSDLFVGGAFTSAGGVATFYIAKWNEGTGWSGAGSLGNSVLGLTEIGGDLYAAGNFSDVAGSGSHYAAKWNGATWEALGGGISSATSCVAASSTDVYFGGGYFSTAGGKAAVRIARWNESGSEWFALGDGMDSVVNAIEVIGYDAYIAGGFTGTRDGPASYIARWNGGAFHDVGGGVNGWVYALAASGSDLYVGGGFTQAGGQSAAKVARWDGSQWNAVGSGLTTNVRALAVSGSTVYAGQDISFSDGRVIAYSGPNWLALGNVLEDGRVNALAVSGADLYAGGGFTGDGAVTLAYIARWGAGSWNDVGSGTTGDVYALAVVGGKVYAGGEFTNAGGVLVNNIARWDGVNWSALTSGTDGAVYALATSGTDLYVVGDFTTAGGVTANRIAVWDTGGEAWSDCGSGADGQVNAAATMGDDLYVGGLFGAVGGKVSAYVAWADSTDPWVVSISPAGASPTNANTVDFTVIFSERVTAAEVETSDFVLTKIGADGTIDSVSGSDSTYTVAVNSVTGDGTLRLDVVGSPSITDLVGHALAGPYTGGDDYEIDNSPPPAPSAPDLTVASDTGVSNADDLTGDATPDFGGSAETGATVELFSSVQGSLGTTAAAGGTWLLTASAMSDGAHSITAVATDGAGNSSTPSGALVVTIDTAPPVITSPAVTESSDYIHAAGTDIYYSDLMSSADAFTLAGTASDSGSSLSHATFTSGDLGGPADDATPDVWSGLYDDVDNMDTWEGSLVVTVYDDAGNSATAVFTVTRDVAGPSIDSSAATESSAYTHVNGTDIYYGQEMVAPQTVALAGTASDLGAGLDRAEFTQGTGLGAPATDVTPASWSGVYDDITSADSWEGTLVVTAYDFVGNLKTTSFSITRDVTAPAVSVPSVSESSTYIYAAGTTMYYGDDMSAAESFSLTGTASDGVAGLDRAIFTQATGLGNPAMDATPASWNGTYDDVTGADTFEGTLDVAVYDKVSNATVQSVDISRDVDPPIVVPAAVIEASLYISASGTDITYGAGMSGSELFILRGTASDAGSGLDWATFPGNDLGAPVDDVLPASWAGMYDGVEASDTWTGTIDVTIHDMVGNTSLQAFAVSRDVTSPADPTLALSDQAAASTTFTTATTVDAAVGNDADAAAWILSETQSAQPAADNVAWVASEPTSHAFASATEESKTVYAWTMDAVGNVSVNQVSASITLDTTAPDAPAVTGPASTTDTTPTWTWLQGTSAGNGTFRYQLNGTGPGGWAVTTLFDFTTATDLSLGLHTLYVQEQDDAGNWSSSGTFAIEVDTVPPDAPAVTGDASTTDTTPTWTWTQGAPSGNGTFRHQLDGEVAGNWTETTDTQFTPATALALGDHTLYVQERDDVGNWSVSGSFTTTVEAAPPGDGGDDGGCSATGGGAGPLALLLPLGILAFLLRRRRAARA